MKLAGWKPLHKSAETIETQHKTTPKTTQTLPAMDWLREWLPAVLDVTEEHKPPPAPQATPHPNKPTARNNAINWDQTTHADTLLQTPTASNDFVLSTTSKYTTYIANILHTHSSVQTTAYTSYISAYIHCGHIQITWNKKPKTHCTLNKDGTQWSSPNKFESSR
jgi:deoxyribodipyrimidine photolyase